MKWNPKAVLFWPVVLGSALFFSFSMWAQGAAVAAVALLIMVFA